MRHPGRALRWSSNSLTDNQPSEFWTMASSCFSLLIGKKFRLNSARLMARARSTKSPNNSSANIGFEQKLSSGDSKMTKDEPCALRVEVQRVRIYFDHSAFAMTWRRLAQFCSKKLTDGRSDREQSFNFAKTNESMEKLMTQTAIKTFRFVCLVFMAGIGFPFILASNAFAQLPAPAGPAERSAAAPSTAEVERVVVTGSNIPTAEETGPNPVDTYRPQDIEKLGIRNATDLQTYIPQEAGGSVNLNIGDGVMAPSSSTCAASCPKRLWFSLTASGSPMGR